MPQIIPLIKSVAGFDALGLGQLGQAIRVVDLARGLPRSIGLGTVTQVLENITRQTATRAAYLYLGELGMDLSMPDEHTASERSSYAEHALINRSPRLQWTGDELATRRLGLKLHSQLCDVDAALAWLSKARQDHVPLPLVMGTGKYLGYFVVLSMEQREICHETSAIKYVAVTLELKEYVPSPDEIERMAKPKQLPAVRKAGTPMPGLTRVEGVLRDPARAAVRLIKGEGLP